MKNVTWSRRRVLGGGAVALAGMAVPGWSAAVEPSWIVLGTGKGKGIYRARWDARTGTVGRPELAVETYRPIFFAQRTGERILYTADEGEGARATVSAFRYEAATGKLRLLDRASSGADGACFVSATAEPRALWAADYAGGALSARRIGMDGGFLEPAQTFRAPKLDRPGPVADRQDAPHLHCAYVANERPEDCFVCDLGGDRIFTFPVGGPGGLFREPAITATRPGSGPRHIVHLGGAWFLVMHELDCTVEVFGKAAGQPLRRVEGSAVVALPEGVRVTPAITGCEIVVAPGGRTVYTCTRGANVITVFAVEQKEGQPRLRAIQNVPCGGEQPRWIGLDPTGGWLLATNQVGNSVAAFAVERRSGRLRMAGTPVEAESPMCVAWLV